MSNFATLFSRCVGPALARQLALADLLGDRGWNVNISEQKVQFGDDLEFPIQLLGTEAEEAGTWLWAWANAQSNLPPTLVQVANQLRDYGQKHGIVELTVRSFGLDVADGHSLSLVASGLHGKSCYYRGPYDGGALFFLVLDPPAEILAPVPTERALTVLSEVISIFSVDHVAMAESFLKSQGFTQEKSPGRLTATRGDDVITLTFDDQQRLANMEAQVKPRAAGS